MRGHNLSVAAANEGIMEEPGQLRDSLTPSGPYDKALNLLGLNNVILYNIQGDLEVFALRRCHRKLISLFLAGIPLIPLIF